MADVQTSEVNAKLAPVTVGPWNVVFWQIFRGWTTFNKTTFAKVQKYEHGGQLIVKIHILLYGQNSLTVALSQMKFCTLQDHGQPYKFYLNHYYTAVFRNYNVGTNYFMWNSVFLSSVLYCKLFILSLFYQRCSNIRDSNTAAEKYSRLYRPINLLIFIIYNMD
jgi:hypothetical protein